MNRVAEALRRAVEVIAAVVGLVLTAPITVVAAVAIRLRMGSPVVFRQQRLGRGGVPFTVLKFRSMAHPAPGKEGPEFDHERLGRLGRFLRASSIDELPSLWNLLRGEIALVGPRPLPVYYWPRFTDEQRRRFEVRPGLTGLAQVTGRNTLDWPERLALDVEYVERRSLWLDLTIVARTVPVVLGRSGIDHGSGVTMHELPPQQPHNAVSTSPTAVGT
jgi:lipopolysaccharide/colanic/teichoic acid biosynthesis glycosyltransferase